MESIIERIEFIHSLLARYPQEYEWKINRSVDGYEWVFQRGVILVVKRLKCWELEQAANTGLRYIVQDILDPRQIIRRYSVFDRAKERAQIAVPQFYAMYLTDHPTNPDCKINLEDK
jgi:hypothetical protein